MTNSEHNAQLSPIYLRPLMQDDFTDEYIAWFQDEEFTRYLDAKNITREDAIKHLEDGKVGNKWFMYAICETDTDRHIGNVKIGPISWRDRVSDLVTVIGARDAWGKGYGRETVRLAIHKAFKEHNLRKLSASIDSRNLGSIKAYTAGGFAVEATLSEQYMHIEEGKTVLSDKVFVACFNPDFDYV